ncbi:FAD-binding oxidoreductase [Xanthobacter dioxanivorans]|uniref:FAD-binding oxidoreductase n=1 Tax=Xanthobacter dioxanivorans TaxID=2528964 RepID=A0A974SI46_9HYPH|nr:FAD-binding oxidoreductase [Xanthobacter dioxanivorans]QRG06325.1 FAD-binding oxidoreductase [Xanthobacter dioxanivorans]
MTGLTIAAARTSDQVDADLASALAAIVGADNVLTEFEARRAYAHDRLPFANFRERAGKLAGVVPRLVVRPGSAAEVQAVVKLARAGRVELIPFGNGSGVLGGTIPLHREVMVDLRRLDRIVALNPHDAMVTVEAGMNGAVFEQALNAEGFTTGHFPQSIEISTVGGWAACRGGGQASSRYGKIEDMVIGLKAVLPDGTPLEIRPVARRSVGPSVRDLLVGGEGAFGIITELTLRLWRLPEAERGVVVALPSLEAAWEAARRIMQAELRPTVVRIYDARESADRTEGLDQFKTKPILAILVFSGSEPMLGAEQRAALDIIASVGGEVAPDGPFHHWKENRYVAYSQKWQAAGYYNDTVEVTGNWSAIPGMYAAMSAAVHAIYPQIHFGAHWSHVYPEGACQYMTIRLPPMDEAEALPLHAKLWEALQSLALEQGGSIAHHHGVGLFRNPWIKAELGAGHAVLQAIKDALDPDNLMNPGKLGLRPATGAVDVRHG